MYHMRIDSHFVAHDDGKMCVHGGGVGLKCLPKPTISRLERKHAVDAQSGWMENIRLSEYTRKLCLYGGLYDGISKTFC